MAYVVHLHVSDSILCNTLCHVKVHHVVNGYTLLYKHAFMATWSEWGTVVVKQRLAQLVPGWVTQGSCSGWMGPGLLQWWQRCCNGHKGHYLYCQLR